MNSFLVQLIRCHRNKLCEHTSYIERINEVNPILSPIVENRFDEAISDARNIQFFP